MNQFFLFCLLLPFVSEFIVAYDLCKELKCGTDQRSDACKMLSCPAPNVPAAASNGTAQYEASKPSNFALPPTYMWPPYPQGLLNGNFPWDYHPMFPDTFVHPFPANYLPFGPFPPFPPVQYPFY